MKKIFKIVIVVLFFLVLFSSFSYSENDCNDVKKFLKDDTLEVIREKILYNGYGFSVDHNRIFDMTKEEKERFFTRRRPAYVKDKFVNKGMGPLEYEIGKMELPRKFDWRDYNNHTYIGPVRNQGNCGACYSFGAIATAEGVYNVATGRYDGNCSDFSESFIIWCLSSLPEYQDNFSGCDGADYDYEELSALVKYGAITENAFPYITQDPGECTHWNDPKYKFKAWYRIPCGDITAIKTAIMKYGVVDGAVLTTNAFTAYSTGVYEDTNTSCDEYPCYYETSDHAISLVGWDDDDQAFILRNSWGSNWGEGGYMRIKYNAAGVSCAVTYLVANPTLSLALTGIKNEVNYWAFTFYYGSITVKILNPQGIEVGKFVLQRKESGGNFADINTFYSNELISGTYNYTDKYFAKDTEYFYRVIAYDIDGNEITVSDEMGL